MVSLGQATKQTRETNQIDQTNQPVLALLNNTEPPETITSKLPPALARLMTGQWKKGVIPPKWDGKAAERIVEILEKLLVNE